MKIIQEIEKSRMKEITGGAGSTQSCTSSIPYLSCGSSNGKLYESGPCALKVSCPISYANCYDEVNYTACDTPDGKNYSVVRKV